MKKLYLIFILAFLCFQLIAQDETEKFKGTIYSFVPQYLFNSGIRLDVEKQISENIGYKYVLSFTWEIKNQTMNLALNLNEYNSLLGGGINIYHKIFVNWDTRQKGGLYFSYGLSYSYFDIEYNANYLGNPIDARAYINKYGGDLILGYQFLIKKKLSIDLYTGMGPRYSDISTNDDSDNVFNDTYMGYNYTGNLLLLGFRIGLIF